LPGADTNPGGVDQIPQPFTVRQGLIHQLGSRQSDQAPGHRDLKNHQPACLMG
jgi:hypothetical protein